MGDECGEDVALGFVRGGEVGHDGRESAVDVSLDEDVRAVGHRARRELSAGVEAGAEGAGGARDGAGVVVSVAGHRGVLLDERAVHVGGGVGGDEVDPAGAGSDDGERADAKARAGVLGAEEKAEDATRGLGREGENERVEPVALMGGDGAAPGGAEHVRERAERVRGIRTHAKDRVGVRVGRGGGETAPRRARHRRSGARRRAGDEHRRGPPAPVE